LNRSPAVAPGLSWQRARFEDALACQQRGQFAQADAVCERLLRAQPAHADAWHLRGLLAFQGAQYERAIAFIERSLVLNAAQPAAHANIGCAMLALQRAGEALVHFDRALALQAGSAMTHQGRGAALLALARYKEALADFDRALELAPDLLPALCGRAQALLRLRRPEEALRCLERALQLSPHDSDALYGRGNVLFELALHEEALASYDRALEFGPPSVEVLNNRGNALRELGRHEAALESFRRALALDPTLPAAWTNRGNALLDLNRMPDALACYEEALRSQPDFAEALDNRSLVLLMMDRHQEAAACYARLVAVAPQFQMAGSNLFHARCLCCDWTHYQQDRTALLEQLAQGGLAQPFALLAACDDAGIQLQSAQRFVAQKWPRARASLWNGERYGHQRLRIAYVSADLRQHAVAFLMAGVFEQHDPERVETIAIALRSEDGSAMGRRIRSAFGQYIDVTRNSEREIAVLMHELEVDIAVDLMGFTRAGRPGIFAYRPAAVQVSYLGYPGTLGAPFVDYILADEFVIPPAARRHYAEQVVYLPECFQANDDRCVIGERPSRAAVGLPEDGLVLCSFNNSYKLNPPMFDIWMRLLRALPDSVLWLLAGCEATQANLVREAAARGVPAQRLVFARALPYAQHLGRLGLADLFLDTLPFNAGSTASDALRCAVPLLTCAGESLAGRMAGSLLRTAGLPELITGNLEEYERRALEFAGDPRQLEALRARLRTARSASPLFDSARFCRHLEAAYCAMHTRALRGEAPASFAVAPLAAPCAPISPSARRSNAT